MCAVPIVRLVCRAKFCRPSTNNTALSLTGTFPSCQAMGCGSQEKGTDDHFPPASQRLAPQPTQGATWFPFQDIESGRPIDFVMVRIYFIFIILLFHKQLLTEIIIHRSEERASCSHGIEMRGIPHEFIPGGVHEKIDCQICCNRSLHTYPLHCTNSEVPNLVDIISTVE